MLVKEVDSKSIITSSKLPAADYVINPYVGCPHKCMYCYAEYMKRFSNHAEEWGEFLDIKNCNRKISSKMVEGKKILISSVTDPYNQFENKYKKTREILKQLVSMKAEVDILTKSALVCRDIDIISRFENIKVGISLNTLDDDFRKDIEPRASSIKLRIDALRKLKSAGIKTYVFIGPIFPGITNISNIIDEIGYDTDCYYLENLNLRGGYKKRVLSYIEEKYPQFNDLYNKIYIKKDSDYWSEKLNEIDKIFKSKNFKYRNFFYHEKIRKK